MKILAFINRGSSVSYHRIMLPLSLMEDSNLDVKITNDLRSSYFEDIDVFFYSRTLPDVAIKEINLLRNKYGFKICIDVDDYWQLDPLHPFHKDYIKDNFAKTQIRHLNNADFVFTTHERMYNAIRAYYSGALYMFDNAIPHKGQYVEVERKPHPEGLIRLFWQGSITHLEDIGKLNAAIKALKHTACSRYVEMVLAGYEPDNDIWTKIANIYTDKARLRHALLTPLYCEYYYHLYCEADICLVPIRESIFNSKKSNLKILEAANLKLPVIASKVNPYLNMPVRYAVNDKDWAKHIQALVVSEKLRIEEGERLHAFCNEHYNFDKINEKRKQVFEYYSHSNALLNNKKQIV